ncbi:hypothetical protein B296_00038058 [Ensete ventricosum]|uniref:Uncharacterized protein n=1 Tax=Ensete ventricosum TaxID=4639 RepID=A0A426XC26_ENSVE|nr:hypothetical protein B296_00038058 [Ensete ventricosum]
MLRPGMTQEWVGEGELPRERTKNQRWWRPYKVLVKATYGEVVVRVHQTGIFVKGAEEVENTKANSKYQDREEG